MNNVNQLYNKYLDTYKKNYDSEDLNERDEKLFDPNQFEYSVRKNKNQSRLKKILTESHQNDHSLKQIKNNLKS